MLMSSLLVRISGRMAEWGFLTGKLGDGKFLLEAVFNEEDSIEKVDRKYQVCDTQLGSCKLIKLP